MPTRTRYLSRVNEAEVGRLVDRLVIIGTADEHIQAVLIYGSHAAGTADEFSDLDVGLVTTDGGFDALTAGRDELARGLGEPLFVEDFGDPGEVFVILADGTTVELIINRESDVTFDGPYRVLLDKAGVVDRAALRPRAKREVDDAEQAGSLIRTFWHDVDHLTTALGRGNTWWAYGQLDELRRMVVNLARLEAGAQPDAEAYWKVDETVPAHRLAALRATVALPELRPMRAAAIALVDLYREIATAVAARDGIDYPAALDRVLTDRLREG